MNLIERWNSSYIYERLQRLQADFNHMKKNTPSNEVTDEDIDVSSKLNIMEQKSTEFSEVSSELDVRLNE